MGILSPRPDSVATLHSSGLTIRNSVGKTVAQVVATDHLVSRLLRLVRALRLAGLAEVLRARPELRGESDTSAPSAPGPASPVVRRPQRPSPGPPRRHRHHLTRPAAGEQGLDALGLHLLNPRGRWTFYRPQGLEQPPDGPVPPQPGGAAGWQWSTIDWMAVDDADLARLCGDVRVGSMAESIAGSDHRLVTVGCRVCAQPPGPPPAARHRWHIGRLATDAAVAIVYGSVARLPSSGRPTGPRRWPAGIFRRSLTGRLR